MPTKKDKMQEEITIPKASFLKLAWHNLRVIYLVLAYRKMYMAYDKAMEAYPGGEKETDAETCLKVLTEQTVKHGLDVHKGFALKLGMVLSVMTNSGLSSTEFVNPKLKNLVGIALNLRHVTIRDDFVKGMVLRQTETYWEVLMWLVWTGFINEAFFKARMKDASSHDIDELKDLTLGEPVPLWLREKVPGLVLPS